MVTLARAKEIDRENLILILRKINNSLIKLKPSSRVERWECEAVGQALDKLHLDILHYDWLNRIIRLRTLNLAMRAIIYDLLEENVSQEDHLNDMLEHSLKFEEILINLD
ncbi:hypothetical protein KKF34_13100 [Myxococcota bacterium]|nr:hypothetical protein [Myxococcota bacterium]MBU1381904.1 hypothetical protein [Myxococcota bacterium]MBU1497805.1 hypothetical protein [Myxococcota bacterium]